MILTPKVAEDLQINFKITSLQGDSFNKLLRLFDSELYYMYSTRLDDDEITICKNYILYGLYSNAAIGDYTEADFERLAQTYRNVGWIVKNSESSITFIVPKTPDIANMFGPV